MTNDEIIDKLVGIRNRSIVLIWILGTDAPDYVIEALPTLYEDNAQYSEDIVLARCVIE